MNFSFSPWSRFKTLILFLIISSFFGYLEWGKDQMLFLWQAEFDILSKMISEPLSVLHPFTVLPLIGQLMLVFTLFQTRPTRQMVWIAVVALSLLIVFMCFIGILSKNFKIFASTVPFIVLAFMTVKESLEPQKK